MAIFSLSPFFNPRSWVTSVREHALGVHLKAADPHSPCDKPTYGWHIGNTEQKVEVFVQDSGDPHLLAKG